MQDQAKTEQQDIRLKHDAKITIATATSRKSTSWKNKQLLYSDFVKKVATTVRTKETFEEYMKLPKADQDDIKDVSGFVGGSLKGGRRKADKVAWRDLITLDADFIEGDFWEGVTAIFDNACLIYSTHKHQPSKPRLRLIIPLSKSVTAEEYVAVSKRLAEMFGIDYFDDTTFAPSRLMYWPSTSIDAEYLFDYQDAPFLDPADILATYNDWRDPREWPESSRQIESRKKLADKQGNPLEKPGMVGAFCRTFSITEAIETFLPDKYEPAGDGRFTFLGGSTSGGLVVYDDLFAYSHHGTDPTSEQLVNAFDLVRLHKYGELDEEAKPGTPINRMPSVKNMNEYLQNSKEERAVKVRLELAKSKLSLAEEDFADELNDDSDGPTVIEELLKKLTTNAAGFVEPTTKNIELIIESLYGNSFKYDEFAKRSVRIKDLPFANSPSAKKNPVAWVDETTDDMLIEIEKLFNMNIQYSKARLIVDKLIRSRPFNPLQELIANTKWDGVERAEILLIEYMGAADTEYNRLVTIHFLKSFIYRVYEAGCKVDEALVLKGAQGIAKSLFARKLAIRDEYFTDSLESFSTKKGGEVLLGKAIIELGELAAMKKSEVEEVKRFISAQSDYFRPAYARTAKEFPRQCIFIGTTNEDEFLVDATGNRRFLPVECSESIRSKHPAELKETEILQVYAEVKEKYYKPFKPIYLDERLKDLATEAQKGSTLKDPALEDALIYVNKPIPLDFIDWVKEDRKRYIRMMDAAAPEDFNSWSDDKKSEWFKANSNENLPKSGLILREEVSAKELAQEGLGVDTTAITSYQMRRYTNILKQLGWVQQGNYIRSKAYGKQRVLSRPKS